MIDHQKAMAQANTSIGVLGQQKQTPMQLDEGSLEHAEIERAWHGFMEQLGLPETSHVFQN
jgi:hypothetical protein